MYPKTLLSTALLAIGASAQSLTEVIANNQYTSALASLLEQYPDIASALDSLNNVTVFAPFNRAINQAVKRGLVPTDEDGIAALLDYHVIPGVYRTSDVTREHVFAKTMLDDSAYTNVTGGQVVELFKPLQVPIIESGLEHWSTVVVFDVEFDGGIIQGVDRILTIPPSITTTAVADNLTAFAGALVATDLLDTLESASDITIFAPRNSAFEAIGSVLGNLYPEELAYLLQYHVIQGTVAYSSDLQSGSVTTLSGDDVQITVEDGEVFVNSARVVNPDILIPGGVLHVIDSVLNPDNTTASPPAPTGSSVVDVWPEASSAPLGSLTAGLPEVSVSFSGLPSYKFSSSSSMAPSVAPASGVAAMPTAAMGAAALFGGAALVANW